MITLQWIDQNLNAIKLLFINQTHLIKMIEVLTKIIITKDYKKASQWCNKFVQNIKGIKYNR